METDIKYDWIYTEVTLVQEPQRQAFSQILNTYLLGQTPKKKNYKGFPKQMWEPFIVG